MECAKCGATLGKYDVHCRACGAEVVPPEFEEQMAAFGVDLSDDAAPMVTYTPTPTGSKSDKLGIAARVAGAGLDALFDIGRIAVGGETEQRVYDEWSMERAIRRSRR